LIVNPIYLTNLSAEICQGESILLGGANQTIAGIYFDTLSTNKGCDSVLRTTLIVNPIYLTNLTAEICQGESILLGGANQTTAGIYFDTLSTNKGCDSVLRTTLIVNPTYLTNLTAEICQGESILLGGSNQTTAGIYFDTLSTIKGCDSVLRTTLIVNPIYLTNLSAEICQGESILLGGANQTTAGIYFDTLATNKGCDSVLRTRLIVNPTYLTNLSAEICQGESILLGGSNQTTAGIYFDTLSTNKGCDSVLRTTLIVNPIYLTNLSAEICQGESILLGGANQTIAGIYFDTLSTNKGCDSVLRTTLIVNPTYLTNLSAEICQGESILLGGSNQTTAGIYFDTLSTNKGCDSVLRTTLIVNPIYLTNLTAEICQGESILLGGTNQTTAGIYFDTLSTNKGCDSVLRTTLIVNPIYLTNLSAEICQGESILLGGSNQTTAGIYFDTLSTNKGCDSVLRTTLIVNPTYLTNLSAEICQGESILLGGSNQTTAGIYFDTLSTNKGCDSVLRTTLIVNPIYLTNLSAEICQGESILLGGSNQTTAGIYFDTLSTNKGCDSVLRTTLIVNPTYLTNLSAEICQGESILLGGANQTTAGIYFDTLSTNKGCDSVLRTTLIVNPIYLTNLSAEICQGESILLGGSNQTTAGIYFDTLSTNKGCDSVLRTTLIVNPTYLTNLSAEICQGESILLGGANQTTAGIYFDTLSTNKGCDSVLRTTLIVNPTYLINLTAEICQGESILLGGSNQTTAGIYFDTLATNKGCDSVLRTTLIVNPTYLTNLSAEICQGESILLGGSNQTTAGIYFDTLSTNKGCDSVLRTTLIVNPTYLTNLSAEICQGESILLGGANQTTAGIYFDTLSTNKGCDSVLRTTLIVNPIYLTNLSAEICQGESILLGGSNQTTAGIYFDTLSTNKGCDSVLRTTLIVNPIYLTNLSAEICQGESILLGGSNQTTAGIYFDTLSTIKGCDSVLRTTLIVNPTYLTNLSAEICQGESILLGGSNQTTAGIYFDTLSTNKGCDSVLRTTLIVNPGYVISSYHSICQGESIILAGSIRTTPGIYIDSIQTATGCDSTVYNVLSVNPTYNINNTITICEGDSALINGQYQYFAGTYTQNLTTQFGCDSILTTTLLVNPSFFQIVNTSICQGDSLNIGGSYITETGTYYREIPTATGCDSVQQINLLVHQVFETLNYVSICEGTHYMFGELMLTSAGNYSDTMQTVNGCDSIVTTILTVNPNKDVVISTSICEGDSIFLGGNFVVESGIYYDTLSTNYGCDSIIVTKLKLIPKPNADFTVSSNGQNEFNFFNQSTNSVSYVWYFDDNQTSFEDNPFHQYNSSGEFEVSLIALGECGSDTTTKIVTSTIEYDFYNGFSPNGDGKNDYWNIPILDYFAENNVTIINRWGNEVWITENYDNLINRFEGKNVNGDELSDGTYFYILEYNNEEKRGWVFIKR
jgi:gliding motility-associated-like protein